MSAPALFDPTPYLAAPATTTRDQMSADRRRTFRQALDLANGKHPLTGGPLHRAAAPHDDRKAPGARCGTCALRRPGQYPKCHLRNANGHLAYITHGAATDVRAWWPACADYRPEQEK